MTTVLYLVGYIYPARHVVIVSHFIVATPIQSSACTGNQRFSGRGLG